MAAGTKKHAKGGHPYHRIWRIVSRIPKGRVATYGNVARAAGLTHGARRVGYALHAMPPGLPVPWHRVINQRGTVSGHPHQKEQRRLLEVEGVTFVNGKVDLPSREWPGRGSTVRKPDRKVRGRKRKFAR
jgi:methylated-DNA-protein-cysteine methyltransferase-like protein